MACRLRALAGAAGPSIARAARAARACALARGVALAAAAAVPPGGAAAAVRGRRFLGVLVGDVAGWALRAEGLLGVGLAFVHAQGLPGPESGEPRRLRTGS